MDPYRYRKEVRPVGDEMELKFQFKKTLQPLKKEASMEIIKRKDREDAHVYIPELKEL
jgi:hypothetical protein